MNEKLTTEFFLPMIPPTVTHQEHKVAVVSGKPVFYEPPELKDARAKLMALFSTRCPMPVAGCHKPKDKYIVTGRLL